MTDWDMNGDTTRAGYEAKIAILKAERDAAEAGLTKVKRKLEGSKALMTRRVRTAQAQLSALRKENERLRAASEWQPIETAPKDGTSVLGYTPAGIFVIYWFEEEFLSDCGRAVVYAGWWSEGGETRPGSNRTDDHAPHCEPTHWQYKPAEPALTIEAP